MIYHFPVAVLWIFLGLMCWFIGRLGLNIPDPNAKALELARGKYILEVDRLPSQIIFLCALPKNKKTVELTSLRTQLGGLVWVLWGVLSGFVGSSMLILSMLGGTLLFFAIPNLLVNYWNR
jgi:hypothetical protein